MTERTPAKTSALYATAAVGAILGMELVEAVIGWEGKLFPGLFIMSVYFLIRAIERQGEPSS